MIAQIAKYLRVLVKAVITSKSLRHILLHDSLRVWFYTSNRLGNFLWLCSYFIGLFSTCSDRGGFKAETAGFATVRELIDYSKHVTTSFYLFNDWLIMTQLMVMNN